MRSGEGGSPGTESGCQGRRAIPVLCYGNGKVYIAGAAECRHHAQGTYQITANDTADLAIQIIVDRDTGIFTLSFDMSAALRGQAGERALHHRSTPDHQEVHQERDQ